jgi:hypothetical protein
MLKKMALLTGALLILGFAVAGGFATPRAAEAVCICAWDEQRFTGINWGKGTSCAAARDNLLTYTAAAARASCGSTPCLGELFVTIPCSSIGGGYFQINGYQEYYCRACAPIEPYD